MAFGCESLLTVPVFELDCAVVMTTPPLSVHYGM